MQYIINLNPIYWYITSVRSCVMWGEGLTANMLLIPVLCAALSLGLDVYKRQLRSFTCPRSPMLPTSRRMATP